MRVVEKSSSAHSWKSAGDAKPAKPGVPVQIGTVDFSDAAQVRAVLDAAQKETAGLDYEVNYSVTSDGKVWRVSGENAVVHPESIPSSLQGSFAYHNHPAAETNFSFSAADVRFFFQFGEAYSKASDHVYEYVMARTLETLDVDPDVVYHEFGEIYRTDIYRLSAAEEINIDIDGFHEVMRRLSEKYHFIYRRWKIDGS